MMVTVTKTLETSTYLPHLDAVGSHTAHVKVGRCRLTL
jgi:hypothetical protein